VLSGSTSEGVHCIAVISKHGETNLIPLLTIIVIIVVALLAIGGWWRYRSRACPAGAAWLLENPLINAIAGAEVTFQRIDLHDGEVAALDIQEPMLQKLRTHIKEKQLHNIHPIHGGAGTGLLEKSYYDRALLVTVLGEIHNQQAALQEIFESLKPGGLLCVTEIIFDPHYTRKNKLRSLCEGVGFREVETFSSLFSYSRNYIRPE
jgi:SAM-dependent methyltransferase